MTIVEHPAAGRYPVAAVALSVMLSCALVPAPLFQLYERAWSLTPADLGIVFAIYSAALIPALLFLGGLSDALGRRRTILLSCSILICAVLVLASAANLGWLLAGRIIQGIALGIGSGAGAAAIREWTYAHERNRAGAVTLLAASGGSAVGVLLSGALAQFAPFPLVTPYLTYVVLLVAAATAIAFVPGDRPAHRPVRNIVVRVPAAMRRPFFILAVQAGLSWAVFAIFIALVPSFVARALDQHNTLVGALVIVAIQIGSAAAAAAGRVPHRQAIAIAMGVMCIGLWGLLGAIAVHNVPLVIATSVLAGAGGGLSYLAGIDLVGKLAPAAQRGEILSGFLVACYLGYSLPAVAVGMAATAFGLFPAFVGAAVVISAGGLAMALIATERNLTPAR